MSESSLTNSPRSYQIGFRTDVGPRRSVNEDAAAVLELPGTQAAFVVCDGMGGLQMGEKASGEAVHVVQNTLTEAFADGIPSDIPELLRRALSLANDAVNALNPTLKPATAAAGDETATVRRDAAAPKPPASALMGTTCVAGIVLDDKLYVAHAGDSRAYLWRGGQLIRLTDDHSYVAERVKAGDITEAEARVSRYRNVITRAIGIDTTVDAEVRVETLLSGDTVVICTDGLTTEIEDPEISLLLRQPAQQKLSPERVASALVDAANKKGGHDNTTVLIVRADGPASAAAAFDAPASSAGVVDLDAPRRRRVGSRQSFPTLVVVLGGLLALAAVAAGVLFMQLRQAKKQLATPTGVASSPDTVDYARLVYDAPQAFTNLGARGDLLAFSRDGGLYFVRVQSGTVTSVGKDGKPLHSDAGSVEVTPPVRDVPSTHIFMATDPQGNLYISFSKNRTIEKRGPDGKVLLTLRGFDRPEALTVNESGDLFVVDYNQIKVLHAHLPSSTPAPKPAGAAAKPK